MRKLFLFLAFICLSFVASAQSESLEAFNQKRLDINKTGMIILGSWAVGNMAISGVTLGRGNFGEERTKHFHQMNIYWNVVNLSLAGFGLYSAISSDPSTLGLAETIKEQHNIEKILLFNAGLNSAYITTGFLLRSQAKVNLKRSEMLEGFGQSLILQGGFLLLFDPIMYLIHQSHRANHLEPILSGLSISGNGMGFVLSF